ncbi:MAG: nucleotidyltransferase family protein [Nitrospiraceae bacterium]|nr:nucleotidyltransferase family protein [Nitrospiraceae bacterium]
MNSAPTTVSAEEDKSEILALMRQKQLYQIPIVTNQGTLVGLEILDDIIQVPKRDNIVVLMAGGMGVRLRPLTNDIPKPLLKVGGKPILETILENFIEYGFRRFYISVNYKAELIVDHFGDGSRWGVEIKYLYEEQKLGTAGALGLLPEKTDLPVVVMNGDVLTKINFKHLLDFHKEHNAKATMCVREYDFQVPFGVVKLDNHRLVSIEEKPLHRFFVNAGIYVLEPQSMEFIPRNVFFDMPTLFSTLNNHQQETSVFPIREYWIDIGRLDDFERANQEFDRNFE